MAETIVRRERRRMGAWAVVTSAFWVVTAAYLLILVFSYLAFVHPAVNELLTGGELSPQARQDYAAVIIGGLKALLWWPITLIAAAACTTLFTLASRRATLRQIQASLVEISEQLKQIVPEP
ncbi:MAG: hypothetical protein ACYTGY_01805 [Planctomycetota bacterium]